MFSLNESCESVSMDWFIFIFDFFSFYDKVRPRYIC